MTGQATVVRYESGQPAPESADAVAVEEPLEIRLGLREDGKLQHRPISITMRTPGDDFELAAGFLMTEGILHVPRSRSSASTTAARARAPPTRCASTWSQGVEVDLKRLERNFYTTSSCGVCGKSSLDALATGARAVTSPAGFRVEAALIDDLPVACTRSRPCSSPPAACMPPRCSRAPANCWDCAKTSAVTTRSTS